MSGDPDQTGLAPIIRTGGTGLLVPLSPGSTDAEHRADQELEHPEKDPPAPPPPPALPPGPPKEEGPKDDEGRDRSGDDLQHVPLDPGSPLLGSLSDRQEILAREISSVVRNVPQVPSPGILLGAAMKDVGVDPSGRHLTEAQKAFRDALEEEVNMDLLGALIEALHLYELAYEYGVGVKHFDNFAKAVHARNYTLIGQYSKVFKTLLRFQGVDE